MKLAVIIRILPVIHPDLYRVGYFAGRNRRHSKLIDIGQAAHRTGVLIVIQIAQRPFYCAAGQLQRCGFQRCAGTFRIIIQTDRFLAFHIADHSRRCIQLDLGQLHLGGILLRAVCDIVVPVGAGGCAIGGHAAQGGQQPITGILRLHGKAFIAKRKRCAVLCCFCLRTAVHPAFRQQAQHAAGRVGKHIIQRVRQVFQACSLIIGRLLMLIAVRQRSNLLVILAIFKEIAHVVVAAAAGVLNRQRQLLLGQELGLARRLVA